MTEAQTLDAEIARMYTTGESTMVISRNLGLRPAEVISRIRALNLVPPGMGYRKPAEADQPSPALLAEPAQPSVTPSMAAAVAARAAVAAAEPATAERSLRRAPASAEKSRTRRPTAAADAAMVGYDEDDDSDDLATLPGRPKGWLVTEAEMNAIFARSRGRFEDVRLRKIGR